MVDIGIHFLSEKIVEDQLDERIKAIESIMMAGLSLFMGVYCMESKKYSETMWRVWRTVRIRRKNLLSFSKPMVDILKSLKGSQKRYDTTTVK